MSKTLLKNTVHDVIGPIITRWDASLLSRFIDIRSSFGYIFVVCNASEALQAGNGSLHKSGV